MTAAAPAFRHEFADAFPELCRPAAGAPASSPTLLLVNEALADELGVKGEWLRGPGVPVLAGAQMASGAVPVAQAYSGHQFGSFVPVLGDGRALLVGELPGTNGQLREVALKGSGRTVFSRSGDGRAALGPVLREYLVSEAMHALGVPTTRSLAAVSTGDTVWRHVALRGAVLTRVASSHVRVGTLQFAAGTGGPDLVRRLAAWCVARHYPHLCDDDRPAALVLLDAVAQAQAELVARWMSVGFVHGVMNTDNASISGETLDYGPCAFIESYDPDAVFSSIDTQGRYRYGQQDAMMAWNLARLAEALVAAVHDEPEIGVGLVNDVLRGVPDRFDDCWLGLMRSKLGLPGQEPGDRELVQDVLQLMDDARADFTLTWRHLAADLRGAQPLTELGAGFSAWRDRWTARLGLVAGSAGEAGHVEVARRMDAVNPLYIPRNHLVEEALSAAEGDEWAPFHALLEAVRTPYAPVAGRDRYSEPAPSGFMEGFRTWCGT